MDNETKDLINKLFDKFSEKLKDELVKVSKEPCEMSFKTNKKGGAIVKVNGSRISLLIGLASLEKNILKQLNASQEEYEAFKTVISTTDNVEVL